MTDDRLKEIEALATAALTTTTGPNPMSRDSLRRGNRDDARIILELLAEVRRLKELGRCARDLAEWVISDTTPEFKTWRQDEQLARRIIKLGSGP